MDNQDIEITEPGPECMEYDDFIKWYEHGIERGWVTEGFCYTHDGDPYMTEEEEKAWDEGGDPCMPVLKVLV